MKKLFIESFSFVLSLICCFTYLNVQTTQCLSISSVNDENLSLIQDYVTKAGYTCDIFFMDEIIIPDSDMYPFELRKQTLKVYDLSEPTYDGEFYLNESTGTVYEYINDVWICHSANMTVISPGYIDFEKYSIEDLNNLKKQGLTYISKYLSNKNVVFSSFDYFNESSHYPNALKYQSLLRFKVSDSVTTSYIFYNPETQDIFEEVDDGVLWHNRYKTLK